MSESIPKYTPFASPVSGAAGSAALSQVRPFGQTASGMDRTYRDCPAAVTPSA